MKIFLICRCSRPQVFLKFLQNSKENISAGVFLMKLQEGGPQAYYFIKKDTPAQVETCKVFKSTFFIEQLWTTVSGYTRISTVKKFQYQSSLSKSYKEAGGRGRTKLLLPTRINYQKCTLAKRLFKLCDWEFYTVTYCTWFCTEYPYLHSQKVP